MSQENNNKWSIQTQDISCLRTATLSLHFVSNNTISALPMHPPYGPTYRFRLRQVGSRSYPRSTVGDTVESGYGTVLDSRGAEQADELSRTLSEVGGPGSSSPYPWFRLPTGPSTARNEIPSTPGQAAETPSSRHSSREEARESWTPRPIYGLEERGLNGDEHTPLSPSFPIASGVRPTSLWERSLRRTLGRRTSTGIMATTPAHPRGTKSGYVPGGLAERLSMLLRRERDEHVRWVQGFSRAQEPVREAGAMEIKRIISPSTGQAGASAIVSCTSPWMGPTGSICILMDPLLSADSAITRIAPRQVLCVHGAGWSLSLGPGRPDLLIFTRMTHLPSSSR
ncbi:hypothetical protein BJ684DRAFT_17298 [Piptocephalis cylindrospora]|uniref:Uncharacterized protein n=1 Tax=Piptocephalis cylindrospora TaxID=1907219 RepID=A0A4P9Y2Z5_9FUNG|nr:hypothetical protein BJ684DRAFT_17298 [Piptocephalis cylindrospora]|eukprot:RKP12190.1 hypothetical protein BJ684DRAFT_17298 [Piptocephalis cylindrospora]